MPLADTYRRRLRERALDQYGYVTTGNAAELHVPAVELRKIAQRGGLDHVAYGLYRFDDIPRAALDQYMEAVLRVGPGAYLTHDTVLAVHDLAMVNPRRIRVGTPKRARTTLPTDVEVMQRRLDPREVTVYEGIPATTVCRALLDCQGIVMTERLIDAAREGARRGLLLRDQAAKVIDDLTAAP